MELEPGELISIRVLLYTDIASGGNAQYTSRLHAGLRELGADVHLICPWPDEDHAIAELAPRFVRPRPYRQISPTLGRSVAFALAWRHEPRSQRVVIGIANHLEALLIGLVLRARRPALGRCFVVHDPIPHRWFLPRRLRRLEWWLNRQVWRLFDTLVVHTAEGARVLASWGVADGRLVQVSLPFPTPARGAGRPWNDRSGVCLVGTLRPDKDYRSVVRAYQDLPISLRKAHPLRIRGRIAPAFDTQALLAEIGADPRGIDHQLGFSPRGEFEDLLGSSRVCVLPYVDASSASAVAADAAALGCPVLVPAGGALGELLEHAGAGEWPEDERARVASLLARLAATASPVATNHLGFAAPADVARACLGLGGPK